MIASITGNGINHIMLTDTRHRMHLELTGGPRMGVAGFGFGFLDIAQDLLAAQQVTLAGLGQRDASSGAVEQTSL